MWNFLKSKTEKRASALVKKGFNLNSSQGHSLLTNSISFITKLSILYEINESGNQKLNVEISQMEQDLIKNLDLFLVEKVTQETIKNKKERRRLSQTLQSLKSIAFKA